LPVETTPRSAVSSSSRATMSCCRALSPRASARSASRAPMRVSCRTYTAVPAHSAAMVSSAPTPPVTTADSGRLVTRTTMTEGRPCNSRSRRGRRRTRAGGALRAASRWVMCNPRWTDPAPTPGRRAYPARRQEKSDSAPRPPGGAL